MGARRATRAPPTLFHSVDSSPTPNNINGETTIFFQLPPPPILGEPVPKTWLLGFVPGAPPPPAWCPLPLV